MSGCEDDEAAQRAALMFKDPKNRRTGVGETFRYLLDNTTIENIDFLELLSKLDKAENENR